MAFQESGGVKWQISLTLEIMIGPYKFKGKLKRKKKKRIALFQDKKLISIRASI